MLETSVLWAPVCKFIVCYLFAALDYSWGKATVVPFCRSGLPLSENPEHHPKKKNEPFTQEDAFEDTAIKPGFGIVKF